MFARYKEIKRKNEILQDTTYPQIWKQTTSSQHIPLSTFDTKKGKMQIDFLEIEVPFPNTATQCLFSLLNLIKSILLI